MTLPDELLKTDVLGRVLVKKARRDVLLDEFERGSTSAQAFAKLVGIKYQTFASWVQKRRRARKQYPPVAKALPSAPMTAGALRLVEAVAEPAVTKGAESLTVHLPGGHSIGQVEAVGVDEVGNHGAIRSRGKEDEVWTNDAIPLAGEIGDAK